MRKASILVLFMVSGHAFAQYQLSYWAEAAFLTEFNKAGTSLSFNLGLDDKVFLLEYELLRYPDGLSGRYDNVNRHSLSLRAGRQLKIVSTLSFGFSTGVGFQTFSSIDTESPSTNPSSQTLLYVPIRAKLNYDLSKHLGMFVQFGGGILPLSNRDWVSQLNVGIRIGNLATSAKSKNL